MSQTDPARRSPWRIDRRGVIAISVAALFLIVAGVTWFVGSRPPSQDAAADGNSASEGQAPDPQQQATQKPVAKQKYYVDPDSSAVRAAADPTLSAADLADIELIARTPQAIWLVPEERPMATVGAYVAGIVADAASRDEQAAFVVYGIPERDCGNQSAGGLTAAEYPAWVSAIAGGIGSSRSIVILEPDSLALADECGNTDSRVQTIQAAITPFEAGDALVYLDGGHSNWHPAAETADLLKRAGVDRVRGFSTNVSNYNTTADEVAYGEQLSRLTGGAHFVVDTSRNGNGSNGEWCNPSGRALGVAPVASKNGHHDADLWIKTPGESDGECNGGPPAGAWWLAGALALVRN